ncbi:MAG TPA: MerR family DNA-binding transcriptional regulator, partial [Thioploca sp.]|nr:MerR family DNA-binding transcriptional regulator [Thioploca sp.]
MPMMKIGKAAKLLGISIQTLHKWEQTGGLVPDRKSNAGTRYYDADKLMEQLKKSSGRKKMKGTRIVFSRNLNPGKYQALDEQAHLLGKIRSEVWQSFGSINSVGINHRTVRTDWVKSRDFSPLPAKAWKETLRDALDNIHLYETACKEKVRKQIH